VHAIATALREYRSGLARKGGPIATFLFVGPTGVGKTELSKVLAALQFGAESAMVRFDMTEYQTMEGLYRFIGSPDGTVRGALTEAVREKPYSVILLDEFEKAHPDILNLFLQVLDDGRLTDASGRVVDFQNTIIIATSNAHSDLINDALSKGQGVAEIADYLKRRLVDIFRPELLNRFSGIIVFKNLSLADVARIAELNLKDIVRLLEEQGVAFSYDNDALALVAKLGYEPAFGARPLRRVIESKIRAVLAEKMLAKEIVRGGSVVLSAEGETFVFHTS
jgi:ATP-dependent Clp protease ATP-binding subunit ClpA